MNLVTKKFSQRRIFDFALLLLGVFIIVGVLFFANPKFYANISTHIPSGANGTTETVNDGFVGGDHVQVYYLGWKLKKFLQGDAPSIFADFFNFASDTHLFYDIHVGVQYWLIAVGSLIFGDALGYNLGWVLFPLVLGFVFSYFMLVQITSSRVMCFLGGLFLTFFPYKVSQIFGGHSGGVVFFLLPLFFFAVFRVQRLGGNLPTSALAGVCLFLVTISDEHLGYYLLLFSSMVFPLWGLQALVREKKLKALSHYVLQWLPLIGGLVATVVFGLIVNKILYDPAVTVKPVRTFGEIAHYSPSPTEFGQYASFILLAAFCAAIALIADNWSQRKSVLSSGWLPVAFAAVILLFLSFGIGPHKLQKTGLYKFFYHYFPFFSYQRVPTKIFAPVVCLLMALSAVLVEKLISRMRTKEQPYKRAIYSLMVAALLSSVAYHAGFFFYQLHQSRRLSLMALDSDRLGHLRKYVEANAIILNLPLREKMDTMANYAQYLAFNSDRRVANGYVGNPPRYFRESQEALSYLNEGWLTSRGADRIREHGFDYIWLDASQFPSAEAMRITVERLRQIKGLECVFCGSKEALFKIDALNLSPNRLYTFGWGMPSSRVEKTGRWMVKDDSPVHAEYAHLNFKPYDVMSFVQLAPQEGGRKVAIVLQTAVREPLIVIGAKGEKVSLTPPDFGEGSKQLEFAWSGTSFYLAIEHAYLPLKDGIPDQSNYGHFIESITETVGGESHQLSVF